jgi:hypothetical protein
MTALHMKVPQQLSDPFFFEDYEVLVCPERYMEAGNFFAFEILYYNGEEPEQSPWLQRDNAVKVVIDTWNKEKGTIFEQYKSRDKSVQQNMKKGIALFYMLLFWSNSVPVSLREWHLDCKELSLKPVNVEERVSFIKQNTKLYHSFVQLTELFQEQHKLVAKDRAINNLKKNKE